MIYFILKANKIGDWGLGIGVWGVGVGGPAPGPEPRSPRPHAGVFWNLVF